MLYTCLAIIPAINKIMNNVISFSMGTAEEVRPLSPFPILHPKMFLMLQVRQAILQGLHQGQDVNDYQ